MLWLSCLLLVMRVVIVLCLFLTVRWIGLQYVLVVFPDQTDLLLFCTQIGQKLDKVLQHLGEIKLGNITFSTNF